ncbi:hypothetical protein [Cohnella hashimotonis]|uniref:DUF4179 domain-containing protein n=1 Tax=Cohnella hashimotonis TaxID=2826895 RepID=A0ABT6TD82_9BACL|nr:hypothetical protein [Cohnella hashimotonis]MDI4644729.1 hypothetical protein [Cohnella hashimotonis]
MNEPNDPKWYDQLKGEPLRERNFKETLAARIKERTVMPESRGPTYRRVTAASLTAAVAASCAIFYAGLSDSQTHVILDKPESGQITSAIGIEGPIGIKFGPAILADGRTEAQAYDEDNRRDLTWILPGEHAKLQFWSVRYGDDAYKFGADYYDKDGSSGEWNLLATANFTDTAEESRLSKAGLLAHTFDLEGVTVIAGQLGDDISSVNLKKADGTQTNAEITQNEDGRFWFAIVDGSANDYKLQTSDKEGKIMSDPKGQN